MLSSITMHFHERRDKNEIRCSHPWEYLRARHTKMGQKPSRED
ncbi:hypothetical protein ADIMK_0305 [Marinobacterium lacunae]|uniref:Uncharacterized protein n=1 Tax=Marinobacterium lacunae TaxID=1232683 RepID=A0A081G3J3_9GAMM|nr:hypothetical protein ADIMK_0305 [Marinobacterium lacunae]